MQVRVQPYPPRLVGGQGISHEHIEKRRIDRDAVSCNSSTWMAVNSSNKLHHNEGQRSGSISISLTKVSSEARSATLPVPQALEQAFRN